MARREEERGRCRRRGQDSWRSLEMGDIFGVAKATGRVGRDAAGEPGQWAKARKATLALLRCFGLYSSGFFVCSFIL